MSTSVIASARQSTSSVFTVITRSAETITNLLDAANLSADILTHKARTLHSDVLNSALADQLVRKDEIAMQAANRHVDIQEEVHKRNFPGIAFDRSSKFEEALKRISAHLGIE